jgi:hypothetical protein
LPLQVLRPGTDAQIVCHFLFPHFRSGYIGYNTYSARVTVCGYGLNGTEKD